MEEVETYTNIHQKTVTQLIVIRPIMDMYLEAERQTGKLVYQWVWDQENLELEAMRSMERVVEMVGMEDEYYGDNKDQGRGINVDT